METILEFEDVQVTAAKICVLPLLKTPLATKGWGSPCGTDAISGVIKIEVNVAGVTVREADPEIAPAPALTVVVPLAAVVAIPFLSIAATEMLDEAHTT